MLVFKPLARRSVALLWAGQVLAATGSEIYTVAVVWIATGLIGADAGYVAAVQAAALLAGSLFSGVLTDRWRHATTMIVADLLRAALLLVLSLAGLLGVMTLKLLIVVAGGIALATSAFDPALQATLPLLFEAPGLRDATNALFDATRRMARILGPSLVSLASGVVPTGQFFGVTAVTFVVSAAAVRAATAGDQGPVRNRSLTGVAAILDSLIGGVRAVRGDRVLIYGFLTVMVGNAAWALGVVLGMMLLLRQTSSDPLTDFSLMITAYGVGNLSSSLVLANVRGGRPIVWLIVSKLIFGLGIFLLPVEPGRLWVMGAAAFAATNGPFENLSILRLIQRFSPQLWARIYRLQMCAMFSGFLMAYLAAPALFGWFGVAHVIMASGAVTVAIALAGAGLLGPGVERGRG